MSQSQMSQQDKLSVFTRTVSDAAKTPTNIKSGISIHKATRFSVRSVFFAAFLNLGFFDNSFQSYACSACSNDQELPHLDLQEAPHFFCISSLPFASATLFISSAKKASSYCSYSRSSSFMIFYLLPGAFLQMHVYLGQFHSNTGRLTTEHLRKFCVRQIHQIFSVQQLPFFFAYFLKGG